MPRVTAARYPLQPLLDEYGPCCSTHLAVSANATRFRPWTGGATRIPNTMTVLAELLGVGRETVQRWQREGIPEPAADRAAAMIGVHPSWIWPELWWANA